MTIDQPAWHHGAGSPEGAQQDRTGSLDPDRPLQEQDLLQSGNVFWFETRSSLCDGVFTAINRIDGYPETVFATEAEVIADLKTETCVAGREDYCWCLECDEEIGWDNSRDYVHNRKAIWHPAGGWIEGRGTLPIKMKGRV